MLAEKQEYHWTVLLSLQHTVLVASAANREETVTIYSFKVCMIRHICRIVFACTAFLLMQASLICRCFPLHTKYSYSTHTWVKGC